tara:strand:- start:1501 stop:1980 length:480 start_codon:yes stop_codon:yes gene_type:complete
MTPTKNADGHTFKELYDAAANKQTKRVRTMTTKIITIEDIHAALDGIAAAMTDKGIVSPRPNIHFKHGGQVEGWLHADSLIAGKNYACFYGNNAAIVLADMLSFCVALKSAIDERVANWQKDVAKVIDDGHDLNLPDNVMAPLRASSQAMTENLLDVAK